LLGGFADGAAAVRRQLLFVGLRVAADADARELEDWAANVIAAASVEHLNLLVLDAGDPSVGEPLRADLIAAARRMKDAGQTRRLAVAGVGEQIEEPVRSRAFDAVVTPFNLLSGWRERNLLRMALERQMGVIGYDPCPAELAGLIDGADQAAKPGWFKQSSPLAGVGTYQFLRLTLGWTAEQICLGYALTDPAVSTVQARVADREQLSTLAEVAERDLPAAVSAQIEMARFSAERASGAERRSERRTA
jgi:aryl-alcohol dehydrogenase-like predicted oxidoreductase